MDIQVPTTKTMNEDVFPSEHGDVPMSSQRPLIENPTVLSLIHLKICQVDP